MRIYMVMSVLGSIGGIEAALLPLALELQIRGHEVILYLLKPIQEPNQNAEVLRKAGIRILVTPAWYRWLAQAGIKVRLKFIRLCLWLAAPLLLALAVFDATIRQRSLRRSFQGAWGRLQAILTERLVFENLRFRELKRALDRKPPDVVHVHGWGCGEDPPGAMDWLRQHGYPVVYTEHSSPDPALYPEIPNAPMNLADVIIAVSHAARVGLLKVGRATPVVKGIPYSVEPLFNAPRKEHSDSFVIACVARLHKQKGHCYLLEAFAQVVKSIPNARLLLAGEGDLRQELENRCIELGIDNKVEFIGIVTHDKLPQLYAKTDVVALASLWEGLPVTLIEALSAGMPIVATNVGGNAELVIDGENGFIVPPRDPAALAASLLKLAHDPHLRQTMGKASVRLFEAGKFSPQAVTDQHLEVYRLAVDKRMVNAFR